MLHGVGL